MKKNVYMMGIKGVAMTAMAVYFKQKGFEVSGSDVSDEFLTDKILISNNIKIKKGFKQSNISKKYDFVVGTGAHGGMSNVEMQTASNMGIPVFMHGQMLGKLMSEKIGISIAGCHGKTTTSAFTASILMHSGLDPSYLVGAADIADLKTPGHNGKGKYFIAEADEYITCPITCNIPRFLWQKPKILIITNIGYDHPDAYKNIKQIKDVFIKFTNNISSDGVVIACLDDKNIKDILPSIKNKVITYGFSPNADFSIYKAYFGSGISIMEISHRNIKLGDYLIYLSGRHNLLNALAAGIVSNLVGVDWIKIKNMYKLFKGTKRRLEMIGNFGGKLLYDDYAHHPEEIKATVKAVKDWYPEKRLIVVFQPHTFSRTKALYDEFTKSFSQSDVVIITDIFSSAREKYDPSISSRMLNIGINKVKNNSIYLEGKMDVLNYIKEITRKDDIIVTMGAGDVYLWHSDIINILKQK